MGGEKRQHDADEDELQAGSKKLKGDGDLVSLDQPQQPEDAALCHAEPETQDQDVADNDDDLTASLLKLLDFSSPSLNDAASIKARFDRIANLLQHELHLVVRAPRAQGGQTKETAFWIQEMEYYLQKGGCHEDPFTHGSEEQRLSGRWYFHRAPRRSEDSHRSATSLTAYRGGSRKGLDLTIGNPLNGLSDDGLLRGGILLRTIRRVSDDKVVSGPSLLVDQILSLSGASDIPELVQKKWNGDTSAFLSHGSGSDGNVALYLKPAVKSVVTNVPSLSNFFTTKNPAPQTPEQIYTSPRIGLDLSHPGTTPSLSHPRLVFLPRRYRYFTHPNLLTSNGRAQTFLGILLLLLESGQYCSDERNSGSRKSSAAGELGADASPTSGWDIPKLKKKLVKLTGLKEGTVVKYLEDYMAGLSKGSIQRFVGPAGKGAGSSPSTYLRMMGSLEQMRLSG